MERTVCMRFKILTESLSGKMSYLNLWQHFRKPQGMAEIAYWGPWSIVRLAVWRRRLQASVWPYGNASPDLN